MMKVRLDLLTCVIQVLNNDITNIMLPGNTIWKCYLEMPSGNAIWKCYLEMLFGNAFK